MHKPSCGDVYPTFGTAKASHICVRDYDHPGQHEGCTGITWAPRVLIGAEDMKKMLEALKADPKGFKHGHTR